MRNRSTGRYKANRKFISFLSQEIFTEWISSAGDEPELESVWEFPAHMLSRVSFKRLSKISSYPRNWGQWLLWLGVIPEIIVLSFSCLFVHKSCIWNQYMQLMSMVYYTIPLPLLWNQLTIVTEITSYAWNTPKQNYFSISQPQRRIENNRTQNENAYL